MLSQTGVYALQAALYLARHDGGPATAAVIAGDLDIPGNYLSKVLQRLGRQGIVTASRGPGGGYRLAAAWRDLSVADVVGPFEELLPDDVCLMGGRCDPEDPCTAHTRRARWRRAYAAQLRETTLAHLLGSDGEGPSGLGEQPTNEDES